MQIFNSSGSNFRCLTIIGIAVAIVAGTASILSAFGDPVEVRLDSPSSPLSAAVKPGKTDAVKPDKTDVKVQESVIERFENHATAEAPDFQRHVAPLLGRLGCNGRSCHGSFQGQGGFQLSLFGYDFEADHKALLTDGRVDVETPDESLILTKPTDEDNHEGGLRYEKGSWQFNLLTSWINSGASNPETIQKLDRLVVQPAELRLSLIHISEPTRPY